METIVYKSVNQLGGVGHCFAWQTTRPFFGSGSESYTVDLLTYKLLFPYRIVLIANFPMSTFL